MAKKSKQLIGPFTVTVSVGLGWKKTTVETTDEAKQLGKGYISKWQNEGLSRLKEGAHLFTDETFSTTKTLKIFDAKEKLVTNEVLAN